jgi:hypothetical protein
VPTPARLLAALERIAAAAEQIARHLDRMAPADGKGLPPPPGPLLRAHAAPAPMPAGAPELQLIAASLARLADAVAPQPADVVGTPYVAKQLGCTTVWVAELARRGEVPRHCVVPGTGNGKVWRFYRGKIDDWLRVR